MGMDIATWVETKINGKWIDSNKQIFKQEFFGLTASPFSWRSYSMAAIFGNDISFKNKFLKISELKGFPTDSEYLNTKLSSPIRHSYSYYDNGTAYTKKEDLELDIKNFGFSYITLKELLSFDYDAKILDKDETHREWLSEEYFEHLELLKTLGEPDDVRIVFYFD